MSHSSQLHEQLNTPYNINNVYSNRHTLQCQEKNYKQRKAVKQKQTKTSVQT